MPLQRCFLSDLDETSKDVVLRMGAGLDQAKLPPGAQGRRILEFKSLFSSLKQIYQFTQLPFHG
jgi:hypothetical protein